MVKKLKGTDADQPLTSVCCVKCFCALLRPSKMIYLCRTLSLFFNPWTSNFKTMASHPWFGKQSDHCFWPGAGEAQPTAFAVLLYAALTGILKYVYLMTYLKCRDLFFLRGTLWVSLTWLEKGKTKVQAAQPPALLSIQTCLWALEQEPRVFHVDVLLWSVQNISCTLVVRIW